MNNKRKITLLTLLALLGGLGNIEYAFSSEEKSTICKGNAQRKPASTPTPEKEKKAKDRDRAT